MGMDPNEGRSLFLGGTTNLWRSIDGGATWAKAAALEAKSEVSAVAVSPFDSITTLTWPGVWPVVGINRTSGEMR